MIRRPALAALAALLLGALPGCGRAEAPPQTSADEAEVAAPPAPAAAAAAPAAPAAAAPACPAPQRVELDGPSFVRDDIPAFTPERMEAFRQAAAAAFRSAAEAGCAVGEVSPERLAALRRLLIQSGSGATEATFYEPEDDSGTLVFQYVFAEADLALPEAGDIRLGLACWIDPENEECADREP